MSRRGVMRGTLLGLAVGAVGAALAGGAAAGTVVHQRHAIAHRAHGDDEPFGSLRSAPLTVVADDGVPLHVEVDEADAAAASDGRPTLVFVHGYALNMDCWHFQRATYRGRFRCVFYDQRSHGRSGRSAKENATIDQLGSDLATVLEHVVPTGPVVLVGHSMGGMSILALAQRHPELFGPRVVGVGLVATTSGRLDPHTILVPGIPRQIGGRLALRVVAGLARGHQLVDHVRRAGKTFAVVATDQFAFGGHDVPEHYVEFVDDMLSQTPFEVLAEFFPSFSELDKADVLDGMASIPISVVCGTDDRMIPVEHSRRLHEALPGSTLVEVEGAGHMVLIERHAEVDAALDDLLQRIVAGESA